MFDVVRTIPLQPRTPNAWVKQFSATPCFENVHQQPHKYVSLRWNGRSSSCNAHVLDVDRYGHRVLIQQRCLKADNDSFMSSP